jgi:hypothetical protein
MFKDIISFLLSKIFKFETRSIKLKSTSYADERTVFICNHKVASVSGIFNKQKI